jgi:hypothetical protein
MGRPRPTPTSQRATAIPQPRLGGLLSPFGDVLLSQYLAQPGMLVVHVFPSAPRARRRPLIKETNPVG